MSLQLNPIADCGEVAAGRSGGATAGGDSGFGDESVRASVTDDTSGGGFTVTSIATYHVETVDPGELPPHHHGPPPTVLVTDAHVDGPGPLVVSSGSSLIGVGVTFTAPGSPSSDVYTATVVLTGSSGHRQTIAATAKVLVSTLWYRVGTVSDDTIFWGDSRRYDMGLGASVALYGNVAVEVHGDQFDGALWYRVGMVSPDTKTISWGDSSHYDVGGEARVALYGDTAVEVHQVSGGLVCRVGTVNLDAKVIDWTAGQLSDDGGDPVVALAGDVAVAVYFAYLGGDPNPVEPDIWYRVGVSDSGTIAWRDVHHYDNGFPTGIASYADTVTPSTVVAVHNSYPAEGRVSWYRVGTVDRDLGVIFWGDSHQYDKALLPVVALYRNTVVEVHNGSVMQGPLGEVVASLWYRVGVVSPAAKTIVWGDSHQYDNGVAPSVAFDGDTVVEVHSSSYVPPNAGTRLTPMPLS